MSERNYERPRRDLDETPRGGAQEPPRGGVTDPNGIRKDATQDNDLVGTDRRPPTNPDQNGPGRRL